jgi:hypothetical protein
MYPRRRRRRRASENHVFRSARTRVVAGCPIPSIKYARQRRYRDDAASYFSERGSCVHAFMDVCICDRHVVCGCRAGLLGVPSTALAASAAPIVSQLRQCRARRRRWIEGVERSTAPMVLTMNTLVSHRCLTRVMTDDDRGVEIAQLQLVMQRIQSAMRDVPPAQREYIANALLVLAVSLQTDASTRAARG